MGYHYIRPNKGCQVPTQHIIIDTETIPGEPIGKRGTRLHHFRLACASFFRWEKAKATRVRSFSTTSAEEIIQWILDKLSERRMTWVWSHNAMFDWTSLGLWSVLELKGIVLNYACLESRPNFLQCSVGKAPLWFIDSCNWWRCSLGELAQSVLMEKLPMPDFSQSNDTWVKYCFRDVEILRAAVINLLQWVVSNDLGCLRVSAPGQAMQAWRHKFAPRVVRVIPVKKQGQIVRNEPREICLPITHSVKQVKELERAAYFTGAVRVNYIGEVKGPIYCLDVNSCYPSVMLNNPVPYELDDWSCEDEYNKPLQEKDYSRAIAEVEIHTDCPAFPLRVGSHCVFPKGRFFTTICGPELAYALSRGCILSVHRWATYKMDVIFRDYVNHFWKARHKAKATSDVATDGLCKIMLNSLAGKFGQRQHAWEKAKDVLWGQPWGRFDIINAQTKKVKHYRSLAWLIEEKQDRGEHPNSFPALAAWVTSLARVKMLKLLEVAENGKPVYYSAVDSLHGNASHFEQLSLSGYVGDGLGATRLDCVGSRATYRGIANYSIDGTLHVAGLPRSATAIADRANYVRLLRTHPGNTSRERPGGIMEIANSRPLTACYHHGVINPDGTTRPWILPLEELEMKACLAKSPALYPGH